MITHCKKIIVADKTKADIIQHLRYLSYCNSQSFTVINKNELINYCKWSSIDDEAIILLALNEKGEAICTLRGNEYFTKAELNKSNPIFTNFTDLNIAYPLLDLTIAATHPAYFNSGILQALRYNIYSLFRDKVESVTGVVVNNSKLYNLLSVLHFQP